MNRTNISLLNFAGNEKHVLYFAGMFALQNISELPNRWIASSRIIYQFLKLDLHLIDYKGTELPPTCLKRHQLSPSFSARKYEKISQLSIIDLFMPFKFRVTSKNEPQYFHREATIGSNSPKISRTCTK